MIPSYLPISHLLQRIEEPYRSAFQRFMAEQEALFRSGRGSSHNHQAWVGGYADHVQEVMNLAVVLHETLGRLRPLTFALSDALIVLFVHDLEKLWAYENVDGIWRRQPGMKENAHAFRMDKLNENGITLSPELESAVLFVEGEGSQYDARTRGMSPLAAFCHMCDVASARLWHDHPLSQEDPWPGAKRFNG